MFAACLMTVAGRRWWDGQSWGSIDRAQRYGSRMAADAAIARARGAGIGFDLAIAIVAI